MAGLCNEGAGRSTRVTGHGTLTRWHLARRLDKAGASGSAVVRQWGRGLLGGYRLQATGQQQHQMLLPPQPGSTSCQWLESTPSKRRPPYKRSITVCSCVHVCRLSEQACIARTKRDNAPTPAQPHQTQCHLCTPPAAHHQSIRACLHSRPTPTRRGKSASPRPTTATPAAWAPSRAGPAEPALCEWATRLQPT